MVDTAKLQQDKYLHCQSCTCILHTQINVKKTKKNIVILSLYSKKNEVYRRVCNYVHKISSGEEKGMLEKLREPKQVVNSLFSCLPICML